MNKAYARHFQAKGSGDAWFLVFVGNEALGKQHAIDKAYEELLSWRDDLDKDSVRKRYDVHVLKVACDTKVYDPALERQIPCGLFGIFCPACEYKLEKN